MLMNMVLLLKWMIFKYKKIVNNLIEIQRIIKKLK